MKIKKIVPVFLALVCLAVTPASVPAQDIIDETPSVTVTPTPTQMPPQPVIPEKELRVNGNKISFYIHGKALKNSWQNYKGFRYYFSANGHAYKGTHRINNKIYIFDENGHLLRNQKNKMVTVSGQKYYMISKSGNPATGYFVYKIICIMLILREDAIRIALVKTDSYTLRQVVQRRKIPMLF